MKVLTVNFLTCAVKSCKTAAASFPLHIQDAELEESDLPPYNGQFLRNVLPRVDWDALRMTATELGFTNLPATKPEAAAAAAAAAGPPSDADGATTAADDDPVWRDLHRLLMCVSIREGKLVCANCQHSYPIREGIANFLLPNHLV